MSQTTCPRLHVPDYMSLTTCPRLHVPDYMSALRPAAVFWACFQPTGQCVDPARCSVRCTIHAPCDVCGRGASDRRRPPPVVYGVPVSQRYICIPWRRSSPLLICIGFVQIGYGGAVAGIIRLDVPSSLAASSLATDQVGQVVERGGAAGR